MSEKKKTPNSAQWSDAFLQGGTIYVYRRGNFYWWNGRCYERIPNMLMLRKVSEFIRDFNDKAATGQMVRSVVDTIAQRTAIDDEPPEPLTLDGQPANNVIAFRNGLFYVDNFIKETLHKQSAPLPF
jgi:hypothetical protein